jgi:hypothetical protein
VSGLSTKWGPVPVTLYLSAGPPPVLQFESQDLELELELELLGSSYNLTKI